MTQGTRTMEHQPQKDSLRTGLRKRQHNNELNKESNGWDQNPPKKRQNEKNISHTTPPDKPVDDWEEGLNKDRTSNKRTQRENYERCVHCNHLSDTDMEGDHELAPVPIQPFQDEGYKREVVLIYADWYRVLSNFE